jgi:hypothetical protein
LIVAPRQTSRDDLLGLIAIKPPGLDQPYRKRLDCAPVCQHKSERALLETLQSVAPVGKRADIGENFSGVAIIVAAAAVEQSERADMLLPSLAATNCFSNRPSEINYDLPLHSAAMLRSDASTGPCRGVDVLTVATPAPPMFRRFAFGDVNKVDRTSSRSDGAERQH